MNNKHLSIVLCGIAASSVLLTQCTEAHIQEFPTSAVEWRDSLVLDGSKAFAAISGQYPVADGSPAADSVSLWIAESLARAFYADSPRSFAAPLPSPEVLIAGIGNSYLESARRDFESFSEDGFSTNYEASAEFSPVTAGGEIVSCIFDSYIYSGGAHGSTRHTAQSFRRSDGTPLDYDFVFPAQTRAELIALIRDALREQYFDEQTGGAASLADALLIEPASLALPVAQPEFREDGVTFTYQQYEIAPYAAGMPSCTLPYDIIIPLMSVEAAALCKGFAE